MTADRPLVVLAVGVDGAGHHDEGTIRGHGGDLLSRRGVAPTRLDVAPRL